MWGCWASAGCRIEWIMNKLLTSLVLKVSLVPSEVPAWRSWQRHLSRASSIYCGRQKAALLRVLSATPCGPLCRNTYTCIIQRRQAMWPPTYLALPFTLTLPALALWLRDSDMCCWMDAAFNIEILAFFPNWTEESQAAPPLRTKMPGSCQSPAHHTFMHMNNWQRPAWKEKPPWTWYLHH